ncbi:MAG: glycosyltransferase family 1 protein [Caldilineae bacterium]|nr:MAG: glycosyltransferase family 1 protein [Caldilineae bacterium]
MAAGGTSSLFAGVGIAVMGPYPPRPGGVSIQCEMLAALLAAAGARVTRLNSDLPALRRRKLGRWLLPGAQVLALGWRLWRTRYRWQILHIHAASWWGFMPAVVGLTARVWGKRVVVTYHGGEAARFLARWGWLARPVLRRAHVLITLTPMQAGIFRAHGLASRVIPNILSLEAFPFRPRQSLAPRLLWLRQFEPQYRPLDALAVLAAVQEDYPEAALVMAGGGSLAAVLRETAAKQHLRGIRFRGQLSPEEVVRAYAEADIFLNTSAVDNLPLTLLEAAASGLPIVTTAAGAIPDLIEHGRTGLMAAVGDVAGLAAQVRALLASPELAAALSQAGRELAEQFAWPEIAPRLAAAYGLSQSTEREQLSRASREG